jgi:hypothetical protein
LLSAVGVLVVPLIVVDTVPKFVTNSMAALGSRFGVSVLKILEDIVTMVRPASIRPVTMTTTRIPLRNRNMVASISYTSRGFTGLQSLMLRMFGIFFISCVQSKHCIIDAICQVCTRIWLQIITVVPGIVGDMPGFVLGNATIIITAVGFLVLSELITASAPSGLTILFLAVV